MPGKKKKRIESSDSDISASASHNKKKSRSGQSNKITAYVMASKQQESDHESDSNGSDASTDSCPEEVPNKPTLELITQSAESTAGSDELKKLMHEMIAKQDRLSAKVTDVFNQLALLNKTVAENGESLNNVYGEITDIKSDVSGLKQEQENIKKRVTQTDLENKRLQNLEDQVQNLERKSRERNLRLVGYREREGEDCVKIVENILPMLNVGSCVEVAHRTGRTAEDKPRHIIFRVRTLQNKIDIQKRQRESLKDKDFFIVDDLTKHDLEVKQRLQPVIRDARSKGKKWIFKNGNLYINGQLYVEHPKKRAELSKKQQEEATEYKLPPLAPRLRNKMVEPPVSSSSTHNPPRRHRSLPQLPQRPQWDVHAAPFTPRQHQPAALAPRFPLSQQQQSRPWELRAHNDTHNRVGNPEDHGIGYFPEQSQNQGHRELGQGNGFYDDEPSQSRMD